MTARLTPNWSCSPTLKPPVQPGCRMRRSSSIAISSLRRTRAIPRLSPRRSLRRCAANDAMDDAADTAQVIIRPPLAWGLAVIAGLALDWLVPLPFLRRPGCRLARRDGVCPRAGAPRLGHRYHHQGRFERPHQPAEDRKSTRLNSSHVAISYAV